MKKFSTWAVLLVALVSLVAAVAVAQEKAKPTFVAPRNAPKCATRLSMSPG